ncbi:hypothetical protein F4861DRAFT_55818 [Xylaria intraflava]|nr:hypothetical protein F4861DRAFT_55818 [Xylaria intraflava]
MQTLPFVQVKDLAPSASFYSAVTQPLGLRFLSANASSIVFGNTEPVFEVKAAPAHAGTPRPTRLILSAGSPTAVSAFHSAAKRANPNGNANLALKESDGSGSDSRASASDLEGNILEVRHSQSSRKDIRIVDWNLDVANSMGNGRSVNGSNAPSRGGLAALLLPSEDDTYRIIRRSFTATSTVEASPRPQHNSKSLSTGSVLGTVLGAVAAGAAVGAGITYALSRKDRDRSSQQEPEAPPPFQRRATFPNPSPNSNSNSNPDPQTRYVEMERTVEKVRYPEPQNFSPPAYRTRAPKPESPVVEEPEDRASRRGSRVRDGSASRSPRKPLMITEDEHKSNAGSPTPEPPRVVAEPERRSPTTPTHNHENPKSQLHAELFSRHRHGSSRSSSKSHSQSQSQSQAPEHRSHTSSRSKHDDEHRHSSSRSKHDDEHRSHGSSRSRHDGDRRSSHTSSRSKHDGERRSHGSSRHSSTRPPRDTDDETMTYVSARSEKTSGTIRASKTKPDPPSRASSNVSIGGVPLPPKEIPPPPREAPPTPREVPPPPPTKEIPPPPRGSPPRFGGMPPPPPPPLPVPGRGADNGDDDDKDSLEPDDSISCVEERPKPHARDLPFLQTRERLIIQ